MPPVKGFLEIAGLGQPDQGLPPVQGPVDPGYGVPLPPIVSHPIAPGGGPTHPIAPPTYPVDPDYGIPTAPGVWPQPPRPEHPDHLTLLVKRYYCREYRRERLIGSL